MKPRPVPLLAAGWRVEGSKKIHATKRAAYYEIAKRLVIEKYPPLLGDADGRVPDGWTTELANARFDKAHALFYGYGTPAPGEDYFNPDKWKSFILRVVRFLMFVDKRRALGDFVAGLHVNLLPAEEHALMQADLEQAEAAADKLMAQAAAIRAEIQRRAAMERR